MSKTVIITGGSSGIGKACVELYTKKGYNVVFTGRSQSSLNEIGSRLNGNTLALVHDAADAKGAEQVVKKTIDKFESIDVLICNAGISQKALFEDVDLKVFEDLLRVNLMGAVNYVKFALPYLLKSKGSIVGVSSINGHRGTPGRTAYSASKFAMEGFFESLRLEVKKRGVHVMTISPGYTSTGIRNRALSGTGEIVGESFRDEKKAWSPEKVALYIYSGQQKRIRGRVLTTLGWWLVFFNKWIPTWMDRTVYRVMQREDPQLFKD